MEQHKHSAKPPAVKPQREALKQKMHEVQTQFCGSGFLTGQYCDTTEAYTVKNYANTI